VSTYDTIGRGYAKYRQPDPRIAAAVVAALAGAESVINVGAGTGSYEPTDRPVVAVEPSAVMIDQRGPSRSAVVRAVAERLPFGDAAFDAALAVLTIHHWPDPIAGLLELRRVARRAIVLTFDAAHNRFWLLSEYLPEAAAAVEERMVTFADVLEVLGATRVETVPVPADCVDGFGLAWWRRPEAFLDPEVRACVSFFSLVPPALVEQRMAQLRNDLESGAWQRRHAELLDLHELDLGLRLVVAG
jgi:SAM-dependent methyltransferase